MSATVTQVNAALATILDSLEGSGKPLQEFYAYPFTGEGGYPRAFPILKGMRENDITNVDNEAVMDFIIRILIRDNNDQTSYDLLLSVLDQVIAEFRKDDHVTLSGLVDRFDVSPQVDIYRTGDGPSALIVCDLNVSAMSVWDTTA